MPKIDYSRIPYEDKASRGERVVSHTFYQPPEKKPGKSFLFGCDFWWKLKTEDYLRLFELEADMKSMFEDEAQDDLRGD